MNVKFLVKQLPFFAPVKIVQSCRNWIDSQNAKGNPYQSVRGSWYELIEKGEHYNHPLPQAVQSQQKKAFDMNMSYRTQDCYLFMLRNSFIYRHKGIVLSNFHYCFQEFTHHFNISSLKKFLLRHPLYTFSRSYRHINGTGAVLTSPESHNYYHWLSDVLPRIGLYGKIFDQVDHFCVASSVPEKFLEVLPLFGIQKEKLLLVRDTEKLHFDNLFVASLPGSEGRSPRWAVDFVRQNLLPAKPQSEPFRKIYFKRGTALERKILNEAQVISLLSSKGFEIVEPDKLSITDQAILMQEAKIVVGFHSAALTNLLFAPEGCTVIELFSPDYFRTDCFYTLAGMLEMNYWYMLGSKPQNASWGDIVVPEDALAEILSKTAH